MFTSLTNRKSFGATMPKEARTTVSILLKEMASQGLVKRHELGKRWVEYTRLMPLRKRERFARWVRS
jgi:hypothetical protein